KLSPRRVLDAGSGLARETRAISKRYAGVQIIALDSALGMVRAARTGWLRKAPLRVCADLVRLPLAAESVELVWCNMALHWVNDPLAAVRDVHSVVAPRALAMLPT